MKTLEILRTANRNLLRSRLRTILTVSAIFVGAFTLTLTTALGSGAQQYLDRQLGNVSAPGVFYVMPKYDATGAFADSGVKEYDPDKKQVVDPRTSTLTTADADKIRNLPGIEYAKPYYSLQSEYLSRGGPSKKYATQTVTQYSGLSLDLAAGRLLKTSDVNAVILPENYLSPLGFNTAQEAVGKSIEFSYKTIAGEPVKRDITIVGVMKKSFVTTGEMYIDEAMAQEMAKAQGQSERFVAVIAKFSDVTADESLLRGRITDAGSYTAVSIKEQISTITTIVTAITTGLNVVGIIALFAASFGIVNTLLMSVYERTQEIGLMKALGTHARAVFAMFAFEAALVGFWGSLVAVMAGAFVAQLVNGWASSSFLKDFEGFVLLVVTPMNALFVVGLIMLIAFLAGTLPAIKASRLNPIDALRSE